MSFDVDTGLRDLDTGDRSHLTRRLAAGYAMIRRPWRHDNSAYYRSHFNTFGRQQHKEHGGHRAGGSVSCWAPLLRAITPSRRRGPPTTRAATQATWAAAVLAEWACWFERGGRAAGAVVTSLRTILAGHLRCRRSFGCCRRERCRRSVATSSRVCAAPEGDAEGHSDNGTERESEHEHDKADVNSLHADFELLQVLGRGGYGKVVLARLNARSAKLKAHLLQPGQAVVRGRRERTR